MAVLQLVADVNDISGEQIASTRNLNFDTQP